MLNTEHQLGHESIPKLMAKLAVPMIIAQFINVLYNMVDRIYIGRIEGVGTLALTGLGVCFPVIMIVSAFSAFAGLGGSPLAAIELGKGDRAKAEKIMGNAITMILTFSVLLTIFFLIFKQPILYTFGASDQTFKYANDYLSIYLVGTVFVQVSLGLNAYITCQGRAMVAMVSILIGAITNIILDPILIFSFNMGVKGAALATIISQAISAVWIVSFLFSKKSSLRIKFKNIKPNFKIIARISSLGISPFIMQATESMIYISFNTLLQRYGGDLYVGSMTVLLSVIQLIFVPVSGFTTGVQSIISFNYGAKNYDRVKKTVRYMLVVSVIMATSVSSFAMIKPEVFAKMFTSDQQLIDLLIEVIPIFVMGMLIFGVQMTAQSTFVGLGKAGISLFVALLRKVILLIPLSFILSSAFGVMGVYYAEPISDATSATVAGILLIITYKKTLSKTLPTENLAVEKND